MSTQAYYVGEVEHHLINYFVNNHIKREMVFLDIGCHHGTYSIITVHNLKKLNYKRKIFYIEALSENKGFIYRSLNENDFSEYVKIFPKGVAIIPS